MVGVDRDLLSEAFEVVSVVLQALYDCEHLFVVNLVVHLRRVELPAVECYWVNLPVRPLLGDHGSEREVRGVCL